MSEIKLTNTSNTLWNDSQKPIAFAEQIKQQLINWAEYTHVTEELGQNRPDTQNLLNNLFLSVYEKFLTFLNDADATSSAINTWKEIERFLADYTDTGTLKEIVDQLNSNIESRLSVVLENSTGSSTTNGMSQKAITDALDAKQDTIADLGAIRSGVAKVGYYECDSLGNSADKAISVDNYALSTGGSMKVKMTNANTADNATLNINSTGAKPLFYDGERASANNSWEAGETVEIYYDGTSYYANNVAGGSGSGDGAFDVSTKYPTSGVEGGNTYTLEGALAVLNANLSASKKKGGMSIKFIQSSDNSYVQCRLMSDAWSINTKDWAICEDIILVENPEFTAVYIDKDGKIIKAIKTDGTEMLAAGLEVHGNISTDGTDITMIENPEFAAVWFDKNKKILFGIQNNGNFFFGCGVPLQIIHYIEKKLSDLSLDEYEDIVAFIGNLLNSEETLAELLSEKVDKKDGKSLIDEDVADGMHYDHDNPEFVDVETDSEGKILEAHGNDGTKIFETDIRVKGGIETKHYVTKNVDCPEYLEVETDNKGKILSGTRRDGSHYIRNVMSESLDALVEKEEGKELVSSELVKSLYLSESPEHTEVVIDKDKRIISSRDNEGGLKENVSIETPKISTDVSSEYGIEDKEGRLDILFDDERRIISYRDKDGILHEEVGVRAKTLNAESFPLPEDTKEEIKNLAKPKVYNLPSFGRVDIVSETFYLTADARYSDKTGVYLIQDYPDTSANAQNKVTLSNFYIKSTLTDNGDGTYSKNENSVKLDFYAASKVTKVESSYYVTSTLTEVIDPVTGKITGYEVNENSVEVTQITDVPPYKAWPVDKKTEHYCVVNIDFGHYLSGTFYVGVKYQGSSTLLVRKRNFRFTFYKNNKYEKKNKIKIGEFVRLSGFNLKANFMDITRIKENIMNLLLMAVWEDRDIYDRYPWNKEHTPYTGATGMIKGFPIECYVGDEFYGLDIFGLKKDGKNYILDKDADGMIEGGTRGGAGDTTNWTDAHPIDWEDELNDEEDWVIENQTQSNYDALTTFFAFINERLYNGSDGNTYNSTQLTEVDGTMYVTSTLEGGVPVASSVSATLIPFNKETMPERMSMKDWIDYLICLQVFFMRDNTCRNVMLYTGADKKKFYPFFYDLDLSWNFTDENIDADIMIPRTSEPPVGSYAGDMSLWENIKNEWWDEIINRYNELRRSVLSDNYIYDVCTKVMNSVPKDVIRKENKRWNTNLEDFSIKYKLLIKRLQWLDTVYYK